MEELALIICNFIFAEDAGMKETCLICGRVFEADVHHCALGSPQIGGGVRGYICLDCLEHGPAQAAQTLSARIPALRKKGDPLKPLAPRIARMSDAEWSHVLAELQREQEADRLLLSVLCATRTK